MGIKISCKRTSISFYYQAKYQLNEMVDHLDAYLELGPHTRHHTPENLHAHIKYLRNRAYSISAQGQAKILIDRLYECRRFV